MTLNPDGPFSYVTSLTGHGTSSDDSFTIVGNAFGEQITFPTVEVTPQLPNTPPANTATLTNLSFSDVEVGGNTSLGTQTTTGRIVVFDADGDTLTYTAGILGAFPSSHGAAPSTPTAPSATAGQDARRGGGWCHLGHLHRDRGRRPWRTSTETP